VAVAQLTGASGRELLTAIAAGVEVACRVGNALGPGHFDRGWHLTATMGHLGAAVTAGRLLGLDAGRMRHALAIASTEAAGTTEQLGTMTKPLHPGKAAADGIEAALLAAQGFQGPSAPVAGRWGLGTLMAPAPEPEVALEGLGEIWEIEANAFKPYSCGIVSHPVIDAAISLRERIAPGDEIESVEVTVRPVVLEVMGVADPENGLRSKFSVYHCFAVGYLDGGAGPAQYTDERARDPEVAALRRRVTAITDPNMPKDACSAVVRTVRGAVHRIDIDHATGSIERPMTDDQLRTKFTLLVRPRLGERTQRLLDAAWSIDEANDLDELLTLSAW
jgi:2-methylcitrate dehydratase PrpD